MAIQKSRKFLHLIKLCSLSVCWGISNKFLISQGGTCQQAERYIRQEEAPAEVTCAIGMGAKGGTVERAIKSNVNNGSIDIFILANFLLPRNSIDGR